MKSIKEISELIDSVIDHNTGSYGDNQAVSRYMGMFNDLLKIQGMMHKAIENTEDEDRAFSPNNVIHTGKPQQSMSKAVKERFSEQDNKIEKLRYKFTVEGADETLKQIEEVAKKAHEANKVIEKLPNWIKKAIGADLDIVIK